MNEAHLPMLLSRKLIVQSLRVPMTETQNHVAEDFPTTKTLRVEKLSLNRSKFRLNLTWATICHCLPCQVPWIRHCCLWMRICLICICIQLMNMSKFRALKQVQDLKMSNHFSKHYQIYNLETKPNTTLTDFLTFGIHTRIFTGADNEENGASTTNVPHYILLTTLVLTWVASLLS